VFTEIDKDEIRHRALLEVIRFFGSVSACAKALQVSRARVSNWLNKIRIRIPYEYVLLMEHLTQVSIERLSPFTEKTNKAIRSQQNKEKILEQSIEKIIVEQPIPCGCCQQSHPILVGTDGVLIRCLFQLEAYKKMGKSKIPVTIIDVGSLLLGVRTIEEIPVQFLTSDRVAIGLRLEQLIGNRQGQRTDLNKKAKIHKNSSELRPKWDEVKYEKEILDSLPIPSRACNAVNGRRTENRVAKLVTLNSKNTYHRAKQVYLQGDEALIQALDRDEISINKAAQLVQLSQDASLSQSHFHLTAGVTHYDT